MKWILLIAALAVLLAFDLWLARRESHGAGMSVRKATLHSAGWLVVALAGRRVRRIIDIITIYGFVTSQRTTGPYSDVAPGRLRPPTPPAGGSGRAATPPSP